MLFSGPVLGRLVMERLVFAVSDWMLTRNRTEGTIRAENVQNVQIFSSASFIWMFYPYIYSKEVAIFASNFWSSYTGSLCTNVGEKTGL